MSFGTDVRLSNDAIVRLRLGDQRMRAADFAEASLEYARGAELAPAALLPRLCLGVALTSGRKVALAVQQYRAAQRIAEDDLITALLLQGALQELGDTGAAQQVYLDAVRRFKKDGRPGLDSTGSLRRLQEAAKQFPESPIVALLSGDSCQVAQNFAEAVQFYKRAIALAPSWSKPQVNLGLAFLSENKPELAIVSLESALRRDPNNPQANLALGDAQLRTGKPQEALNSYRRVEKVPGVAVFAATGAAQVSVQLGQLDAAVRSLETARRIAPKDPAPVMALAEIQMKQRSFADAAGTYAAALKLSQEGGLFSARPSLYRALTEALIAAKKFDQAQENLQRALAEEPDNAPTWHRLSAQIAGEKGDFVQVERELKLALICETSFFPQETLDAISKRGLLEKFIVVFRGDYNGARTGLQDIPTSNGSVSIRSVTPSKENQVTALIGLGHLYRYLQRYPEEVSVRRDLVSLRGNGGDWFLLAQAQERLGERADARASYSRAIQTSDLTPSVQKLILARIRTLSSGR